MVISVQEKRFQILANYFMIFLSLTTVIPFVIMISSSFSEEAMIIARGYSVFPRSFSLDAYKYIFDNASVVLRAYGVTLVVTAVGTTASLIITNMLAYVLAQKKYFFTRVLLIMVLFTMLFNGGLVATYYVYTQIIGLRNTLFALIVPGLLMNGFSVILVRNYMLWSIPPSLVEAADIDGCGKFGVYTRIVLPLSLPITATIGLLTGLMYWNDWQNGLYYITGNRFHSIQQVLRNMISNVQYLQQTGSFVESDNIPMSTVRMAIAVIAVVPILAVYPFFQKYFVKGITLGAVKE